MLPYCKKAAKTLNAETVRCAAASVKNGRRCLASETVGYFVPIRKKFWPRLTGGDLQEKDPELEARKQRAIEAFVSQQQGGNAPDKVILAQLLQHHGVIVRGGPSEANVLMDSLLAWRAGSWAPPQSEGKAAEQALPKAK